MASKMLFPGVSSGNLTPQYKGTQVRACGNGQLSVIMQILGRENCEVGSISVYHADNEINYIIIAVCLSIYICYLFYRILKVLILLLLNL